MMARNIEFTQSKITDLIINASNGIGKVLSFLVHPTIYYLDHQKNEIAIQ